jgi:hypothetical protein
MEYEPEKPSKGARNHGGKGYRNRTRLQVSGVLKKIRVFTRKRVQSLYGGNREYTSDVMKMERA